MPDAISLPTAAAQRPTSSNAASSSSTRRGIGSSRTVTSTTTPSMPSEPTTSASRPRPGASPDLRAERQQLAVHRDELDREHVVDRQAVLQAMHATGILGDVAADRARDLRRRIGRVIQAVRRRCLRDREVRDAGLDARDAAARIDFENPIEPRQHEQQPARDGQRAAGEPGAGAARHDGNGIPPAGAQHGLNLLGGIAATRRDRVPVDARSMHRTRTRRTHRLTVSNPFPRMARVPSRRPGQCSRVRVRMPVGVPSSSRSAGRRANRPQATTPASWLMRVSRPTGSVMSSPCTSRM